MNALYPKARERFAKGLIDWTGGNVKATALVAGYTFNAAHEFYSSIPAPQRLFSWTLTAPTAALGILDAADHTQMGVGAGVTIVAVVLWLSTGVDNTSPLIAYIGDAADTTPLAVATYGGDIDIVWPNGPTKIGRI